MSVMWGGTGRAVTAEPTGEKAQGDLITVYKSLCISDGDERWKQTLPSDAQWQDKRSWVQALLDWQWDTSHTSNAILDYVRSCELHFAPSQVCCSIFGGCSHCPFLCPPPSPHSPSHCFGLIPSMYFSWEAPTGPGSLSAVQSSCWEELFGTSTIDLFTRPKIMRGFI